MSSRRKKLRHLLVIQSITREYRGFLHEAWPLGKLLNPPFKMPLSLCRQMADDTKVTPSVRRPPNPPTAVLAIFAKSGSQRLSRSGLGLPNKFFIPSVNRRVVARASARPNQPACHSQSLSLYMADMGMPFRMPGPGTRKRHIRKMMTAGATTAITPSTAVEICSLSTYGKDISGLVRSKGR